jgi:ubiquinone/menaquinone biosynthesis C-methylase UbiE
VNETGNFDKIAAVYRWLEYLTFANTLQRCRTHYLPELSTCKRALILGDGDGRFTAALLKSNPTINVDAVDTSAVMLSLLKKRCGATTRLRLHLADARSFIPGGGYDLVVTHFFLDCLSQGDTETLVKRVSCKTNPNFQWLLSEFAIPTGPMGAIAKVVIRLMYLGFKMMTGLRAAKVPDYEAAFHAAGFQCENSHRSLGGLLKADLWQASRAAIN